MSDLADGTSADGGLSRTAIKRFGYVSAIYQSFYSRDLYRDVGGHWTGMGLLYLLVLLAICWIPTAIRLFLGLQAFALTTVPLIVQQLPTVTISGGEMRCDPPGRHVVADPMSATASSAPVLIIDDSIDTVPPDIEVEGAVLTRREFGTIRRSRNNERRIWKLTPSADMTLTPDRVGSFLTSVRLWMPPVLYVFALLGSLVFRGLQACLYAALVPMLARRFATRAAASLDFRAALRLSIVAITPVVVIQTLLSFGSWVPAWYVRWPVAIAITVAYLKMAVESAATEPAGSTLTT